MLHDNDDVFDTVPGDSTVPPFSIIRDERKNPVNNPPYQFPLHLHSVVNDEVEKLLSQNIIEPSHSHSWYSPIVPVKKPDSTVMLCVDYRALNSVTPLDRHHIPTLSTLLQDLGQSTVLSKLDLTLGFHQITVDPDSRDFTTFLAPRGKFRFVGMPVGLKNALTHFQGAMDKVLEPVKDCSAIYIDNVIIFFSSWEAHLKDLAHVFQQLRSSGLKAKLSKFSFGKKLTLNT